MLVDISGELGRASDTPPECIMTCNGAPQWHSVIWPRCFAPLQNLVNPERNKADGDCDTVLLASRLTETPRGLGACLTDEDNAEHHNYASFLGGPVPFCEEIEGLRPGERGVNGSHCCCERCASWSLVRDGGLLGGVGLQLRIGDDAVGPVPGPGQSPAIEIQSLRIRCRQKDRVVFAAVPSPDRALLVCRVEVW